MMQHFFRTTALLAAMAAMFIWQISALHAAETAPRHFDFGAPESTEKNYIAIGPEIGFTSERGYGWLKMDDLQTRDRTAPDAARRDFIFGKTPHTFRIAGLRPGRYLLTIVTGDMEYGNHLTQISFAGNTLKIPLLKPTAAEFATLTTTVHVEKDVLDIIFDSPDKNWIVNAISLEPTTTMTAPKVALQREMPQLKNTWPPVLTWDDPTKPLLDQFRQTLRNAPVGFTSTGLTRADYLKIIASNVDFWKTQQNADGAIIDPYRKVEWQYSTPSYAHAAALLVAQANRKDLIESAAKAMDWSVRTLSQRKAASAHEDFYPPMLAHALPLLKPHVTAERAVQWENDIRGFDPFKTYRVAPSGNNWNIVALAGEALFQQMGLRDKESKYVEISLAGQGHHFNTPYGLYLEGPMPYDHFPRIWVADMIAHGYNGPYHAELAETLRRGALTSLFMQSPWGELPAGGRSAHHQWNEAEQCVTYEIYAAQAQKAGDAQLAAIYKRAARLALRSMFRWVRPSGEMQIVKNWVDPAKSHAFEGYSGHSQYNLLPMSMLAIAYHHAEATDNIAEVPAPADAGGFVLEITPLHKIFANAGGNYIEIDTSADHHYDATGLIRVHSKGISPQLGPSDSILAKSSYRVPENSPKTATTGVGVSWKAPDGTWRRLGELDKSTIEKWTLSNVNSSPQRVSFDMVYEGKLFGASRIIEHYEVTPDQVELTTELVGHNGPLRYVWPVLADDGRTPSAITVNNGTVAVSQDGGKTAQTFTPLGAENVRVEEERYPNHNGWSRLAVAEYPRGSKITLRIAPRR